MNEQILEARVEKHWKELQRNEILEIKEKLQKELDIFTKKVKTNKDLLLKFFNHKTSTMSLRQHIIKIIGEINEK